MTKAKSIDTREGRAFESGRPPANIHRADLAPIFIRQMLSRAEAKGLSPQRLLRGLGLVQADLDAPELLVSYYQCKEVAYRFWQMPPSPLEGLEWGGMLNLVSLGKVGLGMMASAHSHDMFRFLAEFQRAAGTPLQLHCDSTERHFSVEARARFDDPALEPFLVLCTLASLHRFTRQVFGNDCQTLGVELALPRAGAGAAPEYERFFGVPAVFDAPANRLIFAPQPCPILTAEPSVLARMRELLREDAGHRAWCDLGAAVAQIIRRSPTAAPPLGVVAAALNLSERSLRRRLAEEGIGYRTLVAEEQRRRTLALVRSSDVAMEDVAAQAGYSSARSLRRAVHRWTGGGPTAVRKAAAQPQWRATPPGA